MDGAPHIEAQQNPAYGSSCRYTSALEVVVNDFPHPWTITELSRALWMLYPSLTLFLPSRCIGSLRQYRGHRAPHAHMTASLAMASRSCSHDPPSCTVVSVQPSEPIGRPWGCMDLVPTFLPVFRPACCGAITPMQSNLWAPRCRGYCRRHHCPHRPPLAPGRSLGRSNCAEINQLGPLVS